MPENRNLKEALINAVHHLNNNNLNECIEQLNEILEHQPNNIDSLSMLLGVYIKLNKSKESLNIKFNAIQEFMPNVSLVSTYDNCDAAYLNSNGEHAHTKQALAEKMNINYEELELSPATSLRP